MEEQKNFKEENLEDINKKEGEMVTKNVLKNQPKKKKSSPKKKIRK